MYVASVGSKRNINFEISDSHQQGHYSLGMILLAGKYQNIIMKNKDASTKIYSEIHDSIVKGSGVMAGLNKVIEFDFINSLQISVTTHVNQQTDEVTAIINKGATIKIIKFMATKSRILML